MNTKDYKSYLVEKRRYFHMHPETGFNVENTLQYIQNELVQFGFETYLEKTGLIGVLKNEEGHTIALRSDCDALEIPDLTNTDYTSVFPNKNHACGHDGHMAMLLGTCKYLYQNKSAFKGTLKVIFQAAEEGPLPGGAYSLSKSSHLTDVESFFALHLMTDYPVNKVISKSGAFMAAVDIININIHGKSSHVGNPQLGQNPIDVLPELLEKLKNIVKEENNLLGITKVSCGHTHNVIPDLCTIQGSLRTFDESYRKWVKTNIHRICELISNKHNIKIEVNIDEGYPHVDNENVLYNSFKNLIIENFGKDNFLEVSKPSFLAEDFSYYQQNSKGIYAYLGSKNECKHIINPNHHYQFDIDEDVLETGMKIYLLIIEKYLN